MRRSGYNLGFFCVAVLCSCRKLSILPSFNVVLQSAVQVPPFVSNTAHSANIFEFCPYPIKGQGPTKVVKTPWVSVPVVDGVQKQGVSVNLRAYVVKNPNVLHFFNSCHLSFRDLGLCQPIYSSYPFTIHHLPLRRKFGFWLKMALGLIFARKAPKQRQKYCFCAYLWNKSITLKQTPYFFGCDFWILPVPRNPYPRGSVHLCPQFWQWQATVCWV